MKYVTSKKRLFILRAGSIISAAQFVVSGILVFSILRLNILPHDILALVTLIVVLLDALTIAAALLGRRHHSLGVSSCAIGLIVALLFTAGSGYMYKSDAFIREVSNGTEERYTVSMLVMADSSYEEATDLEGKVIAYIQDPDNYNVNESMRELKSILGPLDTVHPGNVAELADLLYDGKCDAIILEEAARSQVADLHEDLETATRTIWSFDITKAVAAAGSGLDVTRDSFNVYLCGSDSRISVEDVALNDLNMIVTVNPNTNQILLTSIPRDYYLELASYNGKDKLTHAGVYGIEESMKTVEKFTGLKMDYYVKVSFAALVYVVDAMGGIDVESDTEFTAWTNPDVHIEKGMNHMDGVTALAYARERYAYEEGDIHRAQNQAQVLREVAWRAMSPGILIHYDKLLDALAKGMKTNMSDAEIRSLIRMQLDKKAQWDIADYQMKGSDAFSDECYSMWGHELYIMEPDMDTVKEALGYIEEFMNGERESVQDN